MSIRNMIRDGIEGRTILATMRFYLFGLAILLPACFVAYAFAGKAAARDLAPLIAVAVSAGLYLLSYAGRGRDVAKTDSLAARPSRRPFRQLWANVGKAVKRLIDDLHGLLLPGRPLGEPVGRQAKCRQRFIFNYRYFVWRDFFGRGVALAMLVIISPVFLVCILLVRLTSRGPAVFRQTRVGKHRRMFVYYRIRTMRVDAEAATGPVWTIRNDPRITPLGRWLRALGMDHSLSLMNVIKGEMALVGPMPERPEFTQQLAVAIPGYLNRLLVLPGITGLAQINLPADTDLESVRRKLQLDLAYIARANAWLDLRILICTLCRGLGLRVATLRRIMRIDATNFASYDFVFANAGSKGDDEVVVGETNDFEVLSNRLIIPHQAATRISESYLASNKPGPK